MEGAAAVSSPGRSGGVAFPVGNDCEWHLWNTMCDRYISKLRLLMNVSQNRQREPVRSVVCFGGSPFVAISNRTVLAPR